MGFDFDEIKNKVTDAIGEHADKVSDGIDKVGDFIDEKTGGKYSEHVDTAQEKAKDLVENLDGEDAANAPGNATDAAQDAAGNAADAAPDATQRFTNP